MTDQPTITKLRVISRQQQLIRLDFEEPDAVAAAQSWPMALMSALSGCGALVLSDYAKGALHDPQPLIAGGRTAGVPVLVDPKGTDFARYRGATLLTPNLHEFEAVVGPCASEQALVENGERLMAELELGALLITRGEGGMTLLRPGAEEMHLPARAREVFDVTGAGDTVIAVLAAAVAGGIRTARGGGPGQCGREYCGRQAGNGLGQCPGTAPGGAGRPGLGARGCYP